MDTQDRAVTFVSWLLVILFILKSLDLFSSINWSTEAGARPVLFDTVFFILSGLTLLFLAVGVIKKRLWVKGPLVVVFVTNILLLIYGAYLVQDWVTAVTSLVGVFLLGYFLLKTNTLLTGKKYIFLQTTLILALLPATLILLLSLIFQDGKLVDDTSLRVSEVSLVPDDANIYTIILAKGDKLPDAALSAQDLLADYPNNWDQGSAVALLPQLQPYIDAYGRASTQQAYQCPTSVNNFSMDAKLCKLKLMRDYAQLVQFAAITEARNGNNSVALEYALAPLRVGNTIVQSENMTPIEYLVGLASMNIGLDTLDILTSQGLQVSEKTKATLDSQMIQNDSIATPLKREYTDGRNAFDSTLLAKQNYFFHPNQTRNDYFVIMSGVISYNSKSCGDTKETIKTQKEIELENLVANIQRNALNPLQPNMLGRMYLSAIGSSLPQLKERQCKVNERIATYVDGL